MPRPICVLALLLSIALAGCGGDDGDAGEGGGERAAVERAARSYIVKQQSTQDDQERRGALSFERVDVSGDEAEARAKSSLTGNVYTASLRKRGNSWEGTTLLTDRPSESSGGDPASGPGRSASTDQVEEQIKSRLLKPLGVEGEAECPPTIKVRRGNNFRCRLTGEREGTVEVTQKDDQGNLNYKVNFGSD